MFQCFILHVTTFYLQAVFDPAKNVLQRFCKCFSVKHFRNIFRGDYVKNKTLKHFL